MRNDIEKDIEFRSDNSFNEISITMEYAPESKNSNQKEYVNFCKKLYHHRSWAKLKEFSENVISRFPSCVDGYLFNARACNYLHDWADGARAWSTVVNHRPDWPEGHFQLARSLARSENLAAAHEAVKPLAILASDPTGQDDALKLLVEADIELGDIEGARAHFEALAARRPHAAAERFDICVKGRNFAPVAVFASILLRTDPDASRKEAIELAADAALKALSSRAASQERAGKLEQAFQDYAAILIFDPDDAIAARNRSRIWRTLRAAAHEALKDDDDESSLRLFQQLVWLDKKHVDSQVQLGRLWMKRRNWVAALPVWREVARAAPELIEAHLQIARALSRSGDEIEALTAWDHILALAPDHPEATKMRAAAPDRMLANGRSLNGQGDFLNAEKLLSKAVELYPENTSLKAQLELTGRKLLQEMRRAFKESDFETILKNKDLSERILSSEAGLYRLLGRVAMKLRRFDEAIPAWKRLSELDPGEIPMCRLQIARCYFRSGRKTEAMLASHEVLHYDDGHKEARDMLDKLQKA